MTCIIGLAQGGNVYIGADSAAASSSGWGVGATKIPKVFRSGDFVMGYTTSFRMGQILQYSLVLPNHDESEKSVACFMLTDFIDAVRACLKTKGFSIIKDNEEAAGNFLVGYRGRLFGVGDDFGIVESSRDFDACGCAEDFALGAMKALEGLLPRERIMKSLEIASHFSGGVVAPFHILGA